MDQMTQHNSALVQETNAAIEQTEQQASISIASSASSASPTAPRTARPQPAKRTARSEGNAALKVGVLVCDNAREIRGRRFGVVLFFRSREREAEHEARAAIA